MGKRKINIRTKQGMLIEAYGRRVKIPSLPVLTFYGIKSDDGRWLLIEYVSGATVATADSFNRLGDALLHLLYKSVTQKRDAYIIEHGVANREKT